MGRADDKTWDPSASSQIFKRIDHRNYRTSVNCTTDHILDMTSVSTSRCRSRPQQHGKSMSHSRTASLNNADVTVILV
jgi:hypothetical protein